MDTQSLNLKQSHLSLGDDFCYVWQTENLSDHRNFSFPMENLRFASLSYSVNLD